MDDVLNALTDMLRELPGIGPRQARRLTYWFARRDKDWVARFSRTLVDARRTVRHCKVCMRMFPVEGRTDTCRICGDPKRDTEVLMVVEKDVDLENIERTGIYKGHYFVLGGTTSPLDNDPEKKIRVRELQSLLKTKEQPVQELVLALSATTEGEDTALYLTEYVEKVLKEHNIKLSRLGRGLSTGSELEYVDAETMKNALTGRH